MAEQDSIRRVAEHLNAADSEAAVCIICLELLKRQDAVWSCTDGCCDTVHLACIQVRYVNVPTYMQQQRGAICRASNGARRR